MTKKFLFAIIFSLLAAAAFFTAVMAQEGTPVPVDSITDNQVNAIAKQLYCPVCENIPLDVCPTQACAEWRELIRLRLAQGWSEDEIKADFALQYGDRVLAAPPAKGLSVLVYVIPPIAILAGAVILYQSLRGLQRGAASPESLTNSAGAEPENPAPKDNATDDYVRRLEEELLKR